MMIERMKVTDRQLKETEGSVRQAAESINSKPEAEGEGPVDIEILMSAPGAGSAVLTAMIASAQGTVRGADVKALGVLEALAL